ncbi:hypothetical protein TBR22_A14520 [Luteitalea sp. TBR-22]|uniref:hypothetical protein n=1 Tax=Luteitalea sp. TBR-22 TaxID=2802971 RepID=UPI001AFA5D63|nr:hypothetical protein [Luteitalea sp. TBR-22]BCS32242.1 hypothetical protein TBR22_A14520 [Luteitalea sp. TBR-22]
MQRQRRLIAAAVVAATMLGSSLAGAAQVLTAEQQLARLAAVAESAEQHTQVADAYSDRAASLEREARRLEKKARQLEQGWYPHEYKAAPMHRAGYTERQDAARARKDARAMRTLADKHARAAADIRNAPE